MPSIETGPDSLKLRLRVLSVEGKTTRQNLMREQIDAAAGLRRFDWDFLMAVTPASVGLTYDQAGTMARYGRTLSPAELSCYASHYEMIRSFAQDGDEDYLLVMEDDLLIDPHFDFAEVVRVMDASRIGYLKLYARALVPARLLLYRSRFQFYRLTWPPGGAQCYVLDRATAKLLAQRLSESGTITAPVDDAMDEYWTTGIPVYALHPWPVLEKNAPTTIHTGEQVAIRHKQQEAQAALTPPPTLRAKLSSKVATIARKLQRRRVEREMRTAEAQVRGGIDKATAGPDFKKFRGE